MSTSDTTQTFVMPYQDSVTIHLSNNKTVEVCRYFSENLENPDTLSKSPMLFIHGWGLSPHSYDKPLSSLTKQYNVYAPALPGFGKSSPLEKRKFDLQTYAEAIEETWEQCDVTSRTTIVAHSMGSGVAIKLALHNIELVNNLILICPIGGGGGFTSWPHLVASLREDINFDFAHHALDSLPSLLRNPRGSARSAWLAKKANLVNEIKELVSYDIPVRIIFADKDTVTPPGTIKEIPRVKYNMVSGTHGWLLKDINLFQKTILNI